MVIKATSNKTGQLSLWLKQWVGACECRQYHIARKFGQELNLADCLESARAKILADLNLAVRYGIVIHTYIYVRTIGGF